MSWAAVLEAARRPVDGASAAVFRIGVGLVGLVLAWRFFAHGWVETLFIEPVFHFTYPGFEWVRPWPGWGMFVHFALIGLASLGLLLGYRARICAAGFAVLLAYVELIDRSLYLNHYYWLILTAALIALLPVDRCYRIGAQGENSGPMVPQWVVWLLRFQVGMVYFFSGLAKLNLDWLGDGEPLATWLPPRSDIALIGPLLALPATAMVMAWAGAFFDLTIVVWLSARRTRPYAYAVLVGFHLLTWVLFPSIGVFPLLMILSATIYFEPGWPRRVLPATPAPSADSGFRISAPATAVVVAYLALMLALPLRHHLIPGDVKWTGEGYLGSWQVMLTEKSASATFLVTDRNTGESWRVPPPEVLTPRQQVVMATDPVMIRQAARLIEEQIGEVAVMADVLISFNGRPATQFTDPTVDLTTLSLNDPVRLWLADEPA